MSFEVTPMTKQFEFFPEASVFQSKIKYLFACRARNLERCWSESIKILSSCFWWYLNVWWLTKIKNFAFLLCFLGPLLSSLPPPSILPYSRPQPSPLRNKKQKLHVQCSDKSAFIHKLFITCNIDIRTI